jgi:hypothetical protein
VSDILQLLLSLSHVFESNRWQLSSGIVTGLRIEPPKPERARTTKIAKNVFTDTANLFNGMNISIICRVLFIGW